MSVRIMVTKSGGEFTARFTELSEEQAAERSGSKSMSGHSLVAHVVSPPLGVSSDAADRLLGIITSKEDDPSDPVRQELERMLTRVFQAGYELGRKETRRTARPKPDKRPGRRHRPSPNAEQWDGGGDPDHQRE